MSRSRLNLRLWTRLRVGCHLRHDGIGQEVSNPFLFEVEVDLLQVEGFLIFGVLIESVDIVKGLLLVANNLTCILALGEFSMSMIMSRKPYKIL